VKVGGDLKESGLRLNLVVVRRKVKEEGVKKGKGCE
jgi:hypothetical protein